MSEPEQIELFDTNAGRVQRQRVYVPPEADEIDQYAEGVCRRLVQDDEQTRNELIRGFATFMKVIVRINAKHLNKGAELCPAR